MAEAIGSELVTSWSAQFLDIEGDGLEDLYVVNGFISGPKKDDL